MPVFKIHLKKQPRVSQAKLMKQLYVDIYYGLALGRKKSNSENPFLKKKESSLSWLIY